MTGEEVIEKINRVCRATTFRKARFTWVTRWFLSPPKICIKVAKIPERGFAISILNIFPISAGWIISIRTGNRVMKRFTNCIRLSTITRFAFALVLEEENPSVPTVSDLWKGALYPERELFDMLGFDVPGHPDLKTIDHAR